MVKASFYPPQKNGHRESACAKGVYGLDKLTLTQETPAQKAVNSLYIEFYRRLNASPQGTCPVDLASAFVNLCHAQSCRKSVPCPIGLGNLKKIIDKILAGNGTEQDLDTLEATAITIVDSADCASASSRPAWFSRASGASGRTMNPTSARPVHRHLYGRPL
jgi:hypothetical protein